MGDLSKTQIESLTPFPPSLLELPSEIRMEIYRHLFQACQLSLDLPCHASTSGSRPPVCTCNFPWQITTCCRKLRNECLPLLHASTVLTVPASFERASAVHKSHLSAIPHVVVFDSKAFSDVVVTGTLICSAPPIDFSCFISRSLPALRTLELRNLTIWCQWNSEDYLESDEADESMYNLAMFNLRRNSPRLVELCRLPSAKGCEKSPRSRPFEILLCCQFVGSSLTHGTIVSQAADCRLLRC